MIKPTTQIPNHSYEITINIFPALNGDSILVNFGANKKKHILIDCGFVSTFNNYIKENLLKIADKGEFLEKLIITHIDSDHISGAIPLLQNNEKHFINIKEVWHNSFRHLINQSGNQKSVAVQNEKILKRILARGYSNNGCKNGENEISAQQGSTLGALLLQGNYSWNSDFDNKAVCVENKQIIDIDLDSKIVLLSPDKKKLDDLKKLWTKELTKYDLNYSDTLGKYDDALEMLLTWIKEDQVKGKMQISSSRKTIEELYSAIPLEDKGPVNGSSISFILHINEKKMLFLSDSHPGLILKSLSAYESEGVIFFDSIKVSHHGSFNNISIALLQKIDSQIYIFSTNGSKHNHPDKETIAHIVARKSKLERKLYFNYMTASSEFFNNVNWMRIYNYSIHYLGTLDYKINL